MSIINRLVRESSSNHKSSTDRWTPSSLNLLLQEKHHQHQGRFKLLNLKKWMKSGRRERVLRLLAQIVGEGHVSQGGEVGADAGEYEERDVVGLVRAGTVSEVQQLVKVAGRERMVLYPVSGGNNWG